MIPLADIDLQYEIRPNNGAGVVNRPRERLRVRRVYSAKVDHRKSNITVAMYQGEGAEEVHRGVISAFTVIHLNDLRRSGGGILRNICLYRGTISRIFKI
jgi:hypothetical protein